jgi:hypothetical protein
MMVDGFDGSHFPDAQTVMLPSRAYLLSFRDQTLPARRVALEDASEHFEEARANEDSGWIDMALLGLMSEAVQVLEDVANIGTAYESPIAGLPHYVTATTYSPTRATRFYGGLKNWPQDRFKVLAGLWVRDPETQREFPLAETPGWGEQLDEVDIAAITEAEDATVKLLRPHMLALARAWRDYGSYFHAFKHGGLAINREDFRLVGDDEQEIERNPSIQIWMRKKGDGGAYGDTNLTAEKVAVQAKAEGVLALDVAEHLLDARLCSLEAVTFDDAGNIVGVEDRFSPWQFWLHGPDLSQGTRDRLRDRFGIEFEPVEQSDNPGNLDR